MKKTEKHWSRLEYLHQSVKNPNIHIKGQYSYYSDAWTGSFEETVVRYLYGDGFSLKNWEPRLDIDQLYIGNYVCIAAEAIIMMGGNHNHRMDWFSLYPFADKATDAYQGKGDTIIHDGVWIGTRAIILPGITIGEGAIIAAHAVVTKDVAPYTIVAGNPAKLIRQRFDNSIIERLLKLKIYDWSESKFQKMKDHLCASDIDALEEVSNEFTEI